MKDKATYIHRKYHNCLLNYETTIEVSKLSKDELVSYIEKNTNENKELLLYLLKDLGLDSFKKHINKTEVRNKYHFNSNSELLDFCKKLSNVGVNKISIVKFILQYAHYNQIAYNTFEFYKLVDSVLHFSEEERKQLQSQTLVLTFESKDKEDAKALIKMIEDEVKEDYSEEEQFYNLYSYFDYYGDIIYDNLEFIDYESLKKQFFKARYKGLDFNIQLKGNLPLLPILPKYQLEKQVSTTFLGLAIKKLDFDFAKEILFAITSISIEYYNENEKRTALVESCEVFATKQEEKDILIELKKCII